MTTTIYILLALFITAHIYTTIIIFKYADLFKEGIYGIIFLIIALLLPPLPQIYMSYALMKIHTSMEETEKSINKLYDILQEKEKRNEKLK